MHQEFQFCITNAPYLPRYWNTLNTNHTYPKFLKKKYILLPLIVSKYYCMYDKQCRPWSGSALFVEAYLRVITVQTFFFACWHHRLNSLRKHAYSNILIILPANNENFRMKISGSFHISPQNIYCGYSLEPPRRRGSDENHNLCFWAEIRKLMYTPLRASKLYRRVFVMYRTCPINLMTVLLQVGTFATERRTRYSTSSTVG